MKKLQIIATALFASVLFCGCTQEQDGGKSVDVQTNGAVISLEGNPTTGFLWMKKIEPEGIVKINESSEHKGAPGVMGAPSVFTYEFEGLKEGEATVTFTYERPWEKGMEAAKTRVVHVKVDSDLKVTLSE